MLIHEQKRKIQKLCLNTHRQGRQLNQNHPNKSMCGPNCATFAMYKICRSTYSGQVRTMKMMISEATVRYNTWIRCLQNLVPWTIKRSSVAIPFIQADPCSVKQIQEPNPARTSGHATVFNGSTAGAQKQATSVDWILAVAQLPAQRNKVIASRRGSCWCCFAWWRRLFNLAMYVCWDGVAWDSLADAKAEHLMLDSTGRAR
jgi:hypothetical protein